MTESSDPGRDPSAPTRATLMAVLHQDLDGIPEPTAAVMALVELPPGDPGEPPHRHPGPVLGYVIEGRLASRQGGEPEHEIAAGEAYFIPSGPESVRHRSANPSAAGWTRCLEVVLAPPGTALIIPTDNDGTSATAEGTAPMTDTAPKDVVRSYFEALAAGDQDAIRNSWHEDATCWYGGDLPISGTWHGRDQVIDGFLATAFAHFDPEQEVGLRVTNLFGEGEQVFAEWDSWGTGRTGRRYQQKNSAVLTIRSGRIASMREYADTQHWQWALVDGARS